jgi:hypothetical protein
MLGVPMLDTGAAGTSNLVPVYLEAVGMFAMVDWLTGDVRSSDPTQGIYFVSAGCAGPRYYSSAVGPYWLVGTRSGVYRANGPPSTIVGLARIAANNSCEMVPLTGVMTPVTLDTSVPFSFGGPLTLSYQ